MMKAFGIAVGGAMIIAWLGGSATTAEPLGNATRGVGQFRFLQGSKWYVPAETLPAMELQLRNGRVRALVDQTVWDITNYRDGYFWGRTAAVFKYAATGQPVGGPACTTMVGSVTPDGRIYITFVSQGQKTTLGATRGIGTLTGNDQQGWTFQMQMSTGVNTVIAHWSYMDQCKAGDACEAQLPGSDLSLADFLAQCD
jgi:hypothetical protein